MALVTYEQRQDIALVRMDDGKANALGYDLKTMMAGVEQARALVTRGAGALMRLYTHPQPLVIACSGHALAGGALVLLTGDFRIAVNGAFKIGLNEVQLGMPVPVLAMELARDRLDPRFFVRSTLFAEIADPNTALFAGWVDEVVDEGVLIERALAEATRLAALPADAYAKTKTIMREKTVRYVNEMLVTDMARLTPPV